MSEFWSEPKALILTFLRVLTSQFAEKSSEIDKVKFKSRNPVELYKSDKNIYAYIIITWNS